MIKFHAHTYVILKMKKKKGGGERERERREVGGGEERAADTEQSSEKRLQSASKSKHAPPYSPRIKTEVYFPTSAEETRYSLLLVGHRCCQACQKDREYSYTSDQDFSRIQIKIT